MRLPEPLPGLWLHRPRRRCVVSSRSSKCRLACIAVFVCRVRRDFPYRGLLFCVPAAIWSVCGRLSASPSGSRERADPIPIRDSTGANVCLATRGRRVSPRHASDGHYFSPSMCVCSRTHGLVTSPFLQFFFWCVEKCGLFRVLYGNGEHSFDVSLPWGRRGRPARKCADGPLTPAVVPV